MVPGIKVQEATVPEAQIFLSQFHYDGYGRSAKSIYAATNGNRIISVAKFCSQGRQGTAKAIGLEAQDILELDRFCIHDEHHDKNLGSYLMSRYLKRLKKDHSSLKAVVSFADPEQGHDGTLYKASNWKEMGKTSSSYYYISPKGDIIKKRTFYYQVRPQMAEFGLSESQVAEALGFQKKKTLPKSKFVYFF